MTILKSLPDGWPRRRSNRNYSAPAALRSFSLSQGLQNEPPFFGPRPDRIFVVRNLGLAPSPQTHAEYETSESKSVSRRRGRS